MKTEAVHKSPYPEPYKSSHPKTSKAYFNIILSVAFHNSTPMLDVHTLSAVRDWFENFTKSVSLAGGRNMHANGRKDTYTHMIKQPVSFT